MIKTIFFSTSDRMVPLLEEINKITDIQLCITKKDVEVGRHQNIKENPVKQWCIENKREYIQIDNLKGKDLITVLEKVKEVNPDLGIVVDFNFIVPNEILETFGNKLVNIHYSLLPRYRGASPIQFSILNGDKETGITYQLVHKEMDKGNILMQERYALVGNEASGDLFEQLLNLNIISMDKFVNQWTKGMLKEIVQNEGDATYTYSTIQPKKTIIFKEDAYTELKESPEVIERKIRAFYPRPILWTHMKHLTRFKGLNLKDISKENLTVKIFEGKMINNNLEIQTLQVEGKNKMSWKEFLNGYTK